MNHSENANSSSVTIVPEPCGEPLAMPIYARPEGPRCTAAHRCGACQPLGSLLVGLGWGIGEEYRTGWPDYLAWNLTLAALCCAAVEVRALPIGLAPRGADTKELLTALGAIVENRGAGRTLILEIDPANTYRAAWVTEGPLLASDKQIDAGRGIELREAMRRGFEIAVENVDIVTNDGYRACNPAADFEFATKRLEEEIGRRDRAADAATHALPDGPKT